jgi:predicted nucleotidyltransferase
LERAGLIASERVGNLRILHANSSSPYFAPLRELLLRAFGPRALLEMELRRIRGIDQAYLFGSWASRYMGDLGDEPEDIDVVVVGQPDVRRVRAAARAVAKQVGREVNPAVVSLDEWKGGSPFVQTIRSRPLVELDLAG